MKKSIQILLVIGTFLFASCADAKTKKNDKEKNTNNTTHKDDKSNFHKAPVLNYDYAALEPVIDAKTVEIHFSKHTLGYYKKFLNSIQNTKLESMPMYKILMNISKYPASVRNNAGGYYNHVLYWDNMTTQNRKAMPKEIVEAIKRDFGSFDTFKKEFDKAAKTLFGSGWVWLSINRNGKLFVSTTANQDNPMMDVIDVEERGYPILAFDVWEHSYYLKYQNKRSDYIRAFWSIINWDVVNDRYLTTMKAGKKYANKKE